MPLPLIPILGGAIAAATAGVGIKKGIDAKNDMDLAKSVNQEAQSIAKRLRRVSRTQKSIPLKRLNSSADGKLIF